MGSTISFPGQASVSRVTDYGITCPFPWSSHTNDLKIGTLVATLSGIIGSMPGLTGLVSVTG